MSRASPPAPASAGAACPVHLPVPLPLQVLHVQGISPCPCLCRCCLSRAFPPAHAPAGATCPGPPPPPLQVLHVQSISSWAPSCIGPYSQANCYGGLVFMAGQIPLDPGSMNIITTGTPAQDPAAQVRCSPLLTWGHANLGSYWSGVMLSHHVRCPAVSYKPPVSPAPCTPPPSRSRVPSSAVRLCPWPCAPAPCGQASGWSSTWPQVNPKAWGRGGLRGGR